MNYLHIPYNNEIANENKDGEGFGLISDNRITLNQINAIEDDDTTEINGSSIPDPLARILIFKNAFEFFNQLHTGNPNYDINDPKFYPNHKLLSDCLDLLQLIHENKYNIVIKKWNLQERLNVLENSTEPKHKHLGSTLRFFFKRNSFPSDFIISLIYIKDNNENEILIGGTSPFTLVYTAPDWRINMEKAIDENRLAKLTSKNEGDTFFDDELCLLQNRIDSFQKYIHTILNLNT